jgi:hypothetical protein
MEVGAGIDGVQFDNTVSLDPRSIGHVCRNPESQRDGVSDRKGAIDAD